MTLRSRWALAITLPIVAFAAKLPAQTHDQARLTMGISAGWIGARSLWTVAKQPIASVFESDRDTFHLSRSIRSNISVSAQATYYPHPRLGFTGQFTYVGIGAADECTMGYDSGDAELLAACQALAGSSGTASTTVIQGGMTFRPLPHAGVQPYVTGLVGLAFTPSSTVEMRSVYGAIGDTTLNLTIYNDNHWKEVRPSWTAAIGFATAPSQGYQLRIEFRETWMALTAVTQATTGQGYEPGYDAVGGGAERSVIKGFPSILVGFDVVLARQLGRRY